MRSDLPRACRGPQKRRLAFSPGDRIAPCLDIPNWVGVYPTADADYIEILDAWHDRWSRAGQYLVRAVADGKPVRFDSGEWVLTIPANAIEPTHESITDHRRST